MQVWVLPVKPLFAEQIYEGVKKYELRRRRLKIEREDRIALYETTPVKAITGEFGAGNVTYMDAALVAKRVRAGLIEGCDERDLPYVGLRGLVTVIEVTGAIRYRNPIGLREIRMLAPGITLRCPFRVERWPRLLERIDNELMHSLSQDVQQLP